MKSEEKQRHLGIKTKDNSGRIEVESEKLNDKNYTQSMKKENYFINISIVQDGIEEKTGVRPTQRDIAKKLGISYQGVSNWARQSSPLLVKHLKKLSEMSGKYINDFICIKDGK